MWLLGWFGLRTQVKVACRWDGTHYASSYTSTRLSEVVNKDMQQDLYKSLDQSRLQFDSVVADAVYHAPSPRVCLGCLLQIPTEQLRCGHLLCSVCCQEQTPVDSFIRCPLCQSECLWDHPNIPEGAGYRILALDGGGIRGVVTAVILGQIVANLGIPINQLFDLVVGTGSGGLIALGISEQKRMEDLVAFFHIMSRHAFTPVTNLGAGLAQMLFLHKYRSNPLYDTLCKWFPPRPLLGISCPRVAVVGCIPFLTPAICLFSSYHPARRMYNEQLDGSVLDVAKIFGSGTLYPV